MSTIKNIIFVVLFLTNLSVSAQKIITDRPDQTESSSTIPKGSFQIESGLFFGFTENSTFSEKQILAPTTLFRFGLTQGIEIRIVTQFEGVKNQTTSEKIKGISDLELGTKIQFLKKDNCNTEIAFLSHLIIPTGSKDLTNDKFGSINKLAFSHELNKNIGVGYNLGYNYFGIGNGDFTYSVVLGIGISEKVGIYFEPYGEMTEFKNHFANFNTGLTYLLKDNFQMDVSLGTGINHSIKFVSTGFSWNIGKKNQ